MVKTSGLVIRKNRFGDSSDIVHLLTEAYGLLTLRALGRRRPKSRLGGALELLSYSSVVLYEGRGENWQIREARLIRSYGSLARDAARFTAVGKVLRVLDSALPVGAPAEGLLLTLLDFLSVMEKTGNPDAVHALALVRIMRILGVEPSLGSCFSCGGRPGTAFSHDGGVLCEKCEKGFKIARVSERTMRSLASIERAGWEDSESLMVDNAALRLLEGFFAERVRGSCEKP